MSASFLSTGKRLAVWGWLAGYAVILGSMLLLSRTRFPHELNIQSFHHPFGTVVAVQLALLTVWYYFLFKWTDKWAEVLGRRAGWWVVALTALAVLTWPLTSIDVIGYLVAARNWAEYGVNPLLQPLAAVANPWLEYLGGVYWVDMTSPYGPAFVGLVGGVVRLALSDIWTALLWYKLLSWAAYGWMLWLFAQLLRERGSRPTRLWLLALNPAFLVHGLQDAHNDLLSVALLLAGLLALLQGRSVRAYAWWSVGVVIKLQTVILWPLAWWREGRIQWRTILLSSVFLLAWLVGWMWYYDLTLAQWSANLAYFNRGCLQICAPTVYLVQALRLNPQMVGGALYLLAAWWWLVRQPDIWRAAFWLMFIVVFVATTWFAPWYMMILIPLALLIDTPAYDRAALGLTIYSFLIFWFINIFL